MKITVEIDNEHFEDYYEQVRMHRQMKNGRPVDRKDARAHFKHLCWWYMCEAWTPVLDTEEIEQYVDELDEEADALKRKCPLYKMVKEHEPA